MSPIRVARASGLVRIRVLNAAGKNGAARAHIRERGELQVSNPFGSMGAHLTITLHRRERLRE